MQENIYFPPEFFDLCRKNNISWIGLFGSTARHEYGPESDVNLLVRFNKNISLLKLVRLEREFSQILKKQADLLTEESISPYLKNSIFEDLSVIYET